MLKDIHLKTIYLDPWIHGNCTAPNVYSYAEDFNGTTCSKGLLVTLEYMSKWWLRHDDLVYCTKIIRFKDRFFPLVIWFVWNVVRVFLEIAEPGP